MSYKLVIAEKPSVAQSIAKVISADKREDGYLEGNRQQISDRGHGWNDPEPCTEDGT